MTQENIINEFYDEYKRKEPYSHIDKFPYQAGAKTAFDYSVEALQQVLDLTDRDEITSDFKKALIIETFKESIGL